MKNLQNTLSELRRNKLVWNLLLIVLIILAMAVIAHFVMQAGTRHGARRTVPDFSGIALGEAQRIARANDLRLHINDSLFVPAYEGGTVLDQLPEGGVEVKPGRTVYITINAFRQKQVPVPYVAGRSLRQAKNMLEIAGWRSSVSSTAPDIATNYVLRSTAANRPVRPEEPKSRPKPARRDALMSGSRRATGLTIVPQVIGATLRQAKSRLWELGLNVGRIAFDEGIDLINQKDARVYIQTPGAERAAVLGSPVELRLTLDADKLTRARSEATKQAAAAAEERMRMERERDSLREAGALTALPQPEATEGGPTAEERRSESRPKQQASEPDEFFD